MTVKRLQNIYLTASDMKRQRRFYEEVLGLKVKFADEDNWVQFDVGGQNLALASAREAAPGAAGAVVVLEVDSIEAVVEKLSEEGLEVLSIRDMGSHGRTCAFRDPSGNVVQLFQRQA